MTMEKAVVAVDFSPASLEAARWCARYLLPDAEIDFVHCLELPNPSSVLWDALGEQEDLIPKLKASAEEKLGELIHELTDGRGHFEVRFGHPSEEIATAASEWKADLVVAGKHGGHHGVFHVLGSTAEQLVAACHRPVFLAKSLSSRAPRTILVPVDESDAAARALEQAVELAERHGARIIAHHAVTEWYYERVREIESEDEARKTQDSVEARAREWLEHFVDRHAGGAETTLHVSSGQPGFQTLAAIERFHADMVVVGSHGIKSLIGDPLARLSRFLILSAPCSVFVVPDPG